LPQHQKGRTPKLSCRRAGVTSTPAALAARAPVSLNFWFGCRCATRSTLLPLAFQVNQGFGWGSWSEAQLVRGATVPLVPRRGSTANDNPPSTSRPGERSAHNAAPDTARNRLPRQGGQPPDEPTASPKRGQGSVLCRVGRLGKRQPHRPRPAGWAPSQRHGLSRRDPSQTTARRMR